MIYCQISTRIQYESYENRRGDVLVAKNFPLYSAAEHTNAVIIEVEDEILDTRFNENLNEIQVVVHPYAEYIDVVTANPNFTNTRKKMVLRSRKYLNIDAMPDEIKKEILNPTEISLLLSWSTVQPYFLVRDDPYQ